MEYKLNTISTYYDSFLDIIHDYGWTGACYASTAIIHTLLKLSNIDSTPCIGVVSCENGDVFDHAWIEIEDKIYDIALAYPLNDSDKYNNFIDRSGFRGVTVTPNFVYGIDMDLDSNAVYLTEDFHNIMNENPCWEPDCDYWDLAEMIAKFHKLDVTKDDLVNVIKDSNWLVKRQNKI